MRNVLSGPISLQKFILSTSAVKCDSGHVFVCSLPVLILTNGPPHDKDNKMDVHPAKTQISLGICPVWSESLLCTEWVAKEKAWVLSYPSDSDQTRLICLRGAHMPFCWFCHVTQMFLIFLAPSEKECLYWICHVLLSFFDSMFL